MQHSFILLEFACQQNIEPPPPPPAIYIEECWLDEKTYESLFQEEGYTCIVQVMQFPW